MPTFYTLPLAAPHSLTEVRGAFGRKDERETDRLTARAGQVVERTQDCGQTNSDPNLSPAPL